MAESDNVAAARRIVDAFNRRDLDSVLGDLDPDVQLDEWQEAPGAQSYRGPEGVRRWWVSFLDAMDSVRLKAGQFTDVGEGQVIVEVAIHARGTQSGIDDRQPAIALATVATGELSRLEFFVSLEEARAAARSAPG